MTDRTRLIVGNKFDSIDIDTFRDTWVLTQGSSITCDLNDFAALNEGSGAKQNTIKVAGSITHPFFDDIRAAGSQTAIVVTDTGKLGGNLGIRLMGADQTIANDGEISVENSPFSKSLAIDLSATGVNALTNRNIIASQNDAIATSNNATIINEAGAQITATANAFNSSASDSSETVKVDNAGTITGAIAWLGGASSDRLSNTGTVTGNLAMGDGKDSVVMQAGSITGLIDMGNGNDRIISKGFINGDIDLGTGNDVIDLRSGTIDGLIQGGTGNDTLYTSTQQYRLAEDVKEGIDTVRSTVSYTLNQNVENLYLLGSKGLAGAGNKLDNIISGGKGADRIAGLAGSDTLWGGAGGNDRLKGGEGGDFFIFTSGDGKDTIQDFTSIEDRIDVSDWKAMHKFSDILSHAKDTSEGLQIKFGLDMIILTGMTKAELEAGDFLF